MVYYSHRKYWTFQGHPPKIGIPPAKSMARAVMESCFHLYELVFGMVDANGTSPEEHVPEEERKSRVLLA
jgi:hypothetical protein